MTREFKLKMTNEFSIEYDAKKSYKGRSGTWCGITMEIIKT